MTKFQVFFAALVVVALAIWGSAFTVHERQTAIKLQFGRLVETDYQPGLHFKWPFIERVYVFDKRVLTLETLRPDRALTSEKKNVMLTSFVKWRIVDSAAYFKKTGGDERNAVQLLSQFVKKVLLDAFGKRTVQEVVSGDRAQLMSEVREQAGINAKELGIEIVDVRVTSVEFPADVNESVYRRMEKERATVAKQFRSEGEEQAKVIRADADRQREEVLADAYAKSQQIRGEGDAKATEIYAAAYGRDPEFYNLYRSLDAYRNTFMSRSDVLLLKPDSEFFRYFNDPNGKR